MAKAPVHQTMSDALAEPEAVRVLHLKDTASLTADIAKLVNLESLVISRFARPKLERLPDELGLLSKLQSLEVSAQAVTSLPDSVAQLSNLRTLILAGNHLSDLPTWLSDLPKLVKLDVSENHFEALPDALFELRSLKDLSCGGHTKRFLELGKPEGWGFTEVDPRIFELKKLKKLSLSGNRHSQLGEGLGSLMALEVLDLSFNRIATLPESIGALSKLKTLKVKLNRLSALPASLAGLTKLKTLQVQDNPLVSVPAELLDLPALSAASKKVLESYAGAEPDFDASWRASVPAVVALLGERGTASLFHYVRYQVSGCGHDSDDYLGWIASPLSKGTDVSAEAIYDAMAENVPGGCACAARSFLGL